jgi:hypothetical protein
MMFLRQPSQNFFDLVTQALGNFIERGIEPVAVALLVIEFSEYRF